MEGIQNLSQSSKELSKNLGEQLRNLTNEVDEHFQKLTNRADKFAELLNSRIESDQENSERLKNSLMDLDNKFEALHKLIRNTDTDKEDLSNSLSDIRERIYEIFDVVAAQPDDNSKNVLDENDDRKRIQIFSILNKLIQEREAIDVREILNLGESGILTNQQAYDLSQKL